jgi:hypothetical protein
VKRRLLAAALVAALLTSVLAPSFAPATNAASPAARNHAHAAILDKTRFVLHMGFAYYAFHHFVYSRFHHKVVQSDGTVTYENEFAKGYPHRTANLVKAAVAILFTVHELKVAYDIANKSHSATLHALVKPLNVLVAAVTGEYAKLRGCQQSADTSDSGTTATPTALPTPEGTATATSSGCQYSDKDIAGINNDVNAFTKAASSNGVSISDKSVPVPGA